MVNDGKFARKSKAHPSNFPGEGPATIAVAYSELTSEAFSCWIRLQAEPPATLGKGLLHAATLLNISLRRFQEILRELRRKGYISTVGHSCPGTPKLIVIERRCVIQRTDQFVKLYNLQEPSFFMVENSNAPNNSAPAEPSFLMGEQQTQETLESISRAAAARQLPQHQQDGSELPIERCKFVSESDYRDANVANDTEDCGKTDALAGARVAPSERSRSLLTSLQKSLQTVRKIKLSERSEAPRARERRIQQALAAGRDPNKLDWSKLDHHGAPVISFEPRSREHKRLLAVLQRGPRDRLRRRVVEKLVVEFSRIYTRYRREQERLTKAYSRYEVSPKEQKLLEKAAILCVQKGVTPRQVLEYWDGQIGNFTDLAIVPLPFLASPNNIDRVVCSSVVSKRRPEQLRPTREPAKPPAGTSYGDKGDLDIRLRAALEAAGFDTRMYNDRYLLSIQHSAVSLAAGKRIFMGEGRPKRMAEWAAEHMYMVKSDAKRS